MDIVDLYEAENIFREKYPNERLISVVEWKNYYIFNSFNNVTFSVFES